MLILLSNSVIDNRKNEPLFFDCLRILMQAYKEGLHLIYISVSKVNDLINDEELDAITRSILNHYNYHEAKQASNYFNYFNKVINIINSNIDENESLNAEHNIIFKNIKISKFTKSGHIQPTVLVGEDDNDSEAFKYIGKYYLKSKKLNLNLNFHEQAGGGQNTHKRYKKLYNKEEEPITLCILDSDKKTPKHTHYGDTAKKVIDAHNSLFVTSKNFKCNYYVIDGFLEIENILPTHFYDIKYGECPDKKDIKQQLKNIASVDPIAIHYLDYKLGIKCYSITKNSDLFKEYWHPILENIHNHNIQANCTLNCTLKGAECNKKDDCHYKLITGYGTKILEDFLQYSSEFDKDIVKIISSESEVIQKNWNIIGKELASWGCSNRLIRAI